MKKLTLIFILVCLASCGVEGKLTEDSKNKVVRCKDTRDGEIFTYNTNTAKDIIFSFGGDSSVTITTDKGKEKILTSSMNAYIKCEEI